MGLAALLLCGRQSLLPLAGLGALVFRNLNVRDCLAKQDVDIVLVGRSHSLLLLLVAAGLDRLSSVLQQLQLRLAQVGPLTNFCLVIFEVARCVLHCLCGGSQLCFL